MQFTVVIEDIDIPGFSREAIITASIAMEALHLAQHDEVEPGEHIIEIRDHNNQVVYELSGFTDPF